MKKKHLFAGILLSGLALCVASCASQQANTSTSAPTTTPTVAPTTTSTSAPTSAPTVAPTTTSTTIVNEELTLENAIELAVEKEALVASGTLASKTQYSEEYTYESTTLYTLGTDFIEYVDAANSVKYVNSLISDDQALSVYIDSEGNASKNNYAIDVEEVYGLAVDFFNNGTNDSYGAAGAIKFLQEYSEYGFDYTSEKSEDNHTFSFSYNVVEEIYGTKTPYAIIVEFTLSDNGSISNAHIIQRKYTNVTVDEADKFTVAEDSTYLDSELTFTQIEGAKATENDYTYSKIKVESFDVTLNDEKLKNGQTIEIDLDNGNTEVDGVHRETMEFKVSNVLPETANVELDSIKMTVVGTAYDGTAVSKSNDTWDWETNYVMVMSGKTSAIFYAPGEYDVTFESASTSLTVHVVIKAETPKNIGLNVYEPINENSAFVESTGSYSIYPGNEFYLAPAIDPKFDQNVKYTVTDGATLEKVTVKDTACYKFSATTAGTYTVTFTASENSSVSTTVTITVLEVPNMDEVLAGTYYALVGNDLATVVFDERVSITLADKTQTFAYSYSNGELVLNDAQGEALNYNIVVTSKYVLQLVDANNNKYDLTREDPTAVVVEKELNGTYKAPLMNGMVTYVAVFTSTSTTEGTFVAKMEGNSDATGTYSYVINADGTLAITLIDGTDVVSAYPLFIEDDTLKTTAFGSTVEFVKEAQAVGIELNGTYKAPLMNGMFTYVAVFTSTSTTEGTFVAQVEGNSPKTGTYSYVINEDGTLTITLVDGTDVVSNYALFVEDGTLKVTAFNSTSSFTKEGSSSSETVAIHENFLGTWVSGFATITFEAGMTSITYDGYTYIVASCTATALELDDNGFILTFTYDADTDTISDGNVSFERQTADNSVAIHENFVGTWVSGFATITFEDKMTFVTYDGYTYDVVSCTATALELNDNGFSLTFTYDADTNTISDGNVSFERQVIDNTVEIHENFLGTWNNSFGSSVTFENGMTSLTYEGYTYTLVSCTATELLLVDDTNYELIFTYDAATGTIKDNNDAVFTKVTSSGSNVPTSLQGTWVGTGCTFTIYDDVLNDGSFNYNFTSVTDGVYTFTDPTNASYTYQVVENADGTVTFTAYVNGTKGDVYTCSSSAK